jgi:hypothetical protein
MRQSFVATDLLSFIFETSLSFIVSQALIAQLSSAISSVDKQIIAREIKSELVSYLLKPLNTILKFNYFQSTILSNVGFRQQKRLSITTISSTPRSPTLKMIERSFAKFLLQFVDKISQ